MVLALAALHAGDPDAARNLYERMAETGTRGQSLASIGLADIALFEGDYEAAIQILKDGVAADQAEEYSRGEATKKVAMAQAHIGLGNYNAAAEIFNALDATRGEGQLIPSAEFFAATGKYDLAYAIAEDYRQKLGPARAYANLIDGIIAYHQQEYIIAIEALRAALEISDFWIVRFYLGQAYVGAGHAAEAMAEFENCIERRSETGGLFFDDVPTWRYTAKLDEWKQKAADSLTANHAASKP